MLEPPDDVKPESWQRFFGAVANNAAWQAAEAPLNEIDARDVLDAAHAAAWHWKAVGNELSCMRATMLLAQAHAMAGLGSTALAYANNMRDYFLAIPSTPDWEIAFVHVVYAHAASAAGLSQEHARSYAEAAKAVRAVAGEEDRQIVERVFRHVPSP